MANFQSLEDDEQYARMLQEQFDEEAKKYKSMKKEKEDGKEKEKEQNLDKTEMIDPKKQKMEEMDSLLALKLQEDLYQEEVSEPIPPKPISKLFHFNNHISTQALSSSSQFSIQKPEPNRLAPTPGCIKRMTSDLKEVLKSQNPYIFVNPDEEDVTHITALIIGPPETPYAHGFFHFDMLFPHDYPWKPPKVQLITTDNGRVRFNPNLYANGKVCLSILGTWSGPGWSQVQTLLSVLLSIQSLMNSKPYHNEPGFEMERKPGDVDRYNKCIIHETLRVAVCGMLENPTCGDVFQEEIEKLFLERYKEYESRCLEYETELDGKKMEDPFGQSRGTFNFTAIRKRLAKIKERIENKTNSKSTEEEEKGKQKDEKKEEEEQKEKNKQNDEKVPNNQTPVFLSPFVGPNKMTSDTDQNPMELETQPKGSSNSLFYEEKQEKNGVDLNDFASTYSFPSDLDSDFAHLQQETVYSQEYSPKLAKYTPYEEESVLSPKCYSPFTKLTFKSPLKSELLAEINEENNSNFDPTHVCLICHESPKEYVILPACQQPHVYCMTCANRLLKQKRTRPCTGYSKKRARGIQTLTCILCSAVSEVENLNLIKRRKRRRALNGNGMCPMHQENFEFFCFDDFEMICPSCAQQHMRHKLDALNVAHTTLQKQLKEQVGIVKDKKSTIQTFIQTASEKIPHLPSESETLQQMAKEKFSSLHTLLEKKEKEYIESIKKVERAKISNIKNMINKANSELDQVSKNIEEAEHITRLSKDTDSIAFLEKMEELEEQIRCACVNPNLVVDQQWFEMPKIATFNVEHAIKDLDYREKTNKDFFL